MAASRRLAREIALKTLYQVAIGGLDVDEAISGAFAANQPQASDREAEKSWSDTRDYAAKLVDGVIARGDEHDATLSLYAHDWDPERMPTVDRILLHIALEEIQQSEDVPHGVAINEAVDLAKEYSTEESGRFVNGLLGAYVRKEGPDAQQ